MLTFFQKLQIVQYCSLSSSGARYLKLKNGWAIPEILPKACVRGGIKGFESENIEVEWMQLPVNVLLESS